MKFIEKNTRVAGKLKLLLLLAAFVSPAVTYAQTGTNDKPVVDHIAISVRNLKKSTAFYTGVMHLEKVANPFADTVHQWYNIGNHIKLHVIQGEPEPGPKIGEHLCFTVSDVVAFGKNLEKMNIPYGNWKGDSKEPTHRADGVLQLYFQDPDGYWIEINSPDKK